MIELKDICKTYKSKKGINTAALKDINLKLGNKGLTFILGKSGSGKSTLLNILGGLDTYDQGDLLINGVSTKTFKEKDWDAYRNTYTGFVFQEYNLLENYNVEDNIKLSLELQGKKITSEEVLKTLKMVDLDNISKRKINELSGGQKQRVAIARALVKNPEIILADEPTGNLDSNTSKQIFEILKKLSKEKLVVIVSHDEESANKYADRIIKITDGKIESDTGNISVTKKEREIKFKKARLPFSYSFKMAIGNLFHKKIKLIFTSILIVLCLICLGISLSADSGDINEKYVDIFKENSNTEVSLEKYKVKFDQQTLFYDRDSKKVALEEADVNKASLDTNVTWQAEYVMNNNFDKIYWQFKENENNFNSKSVYQYTFTYDNLLKLVLLNEDLLKNQKIIGRVPTANDEVLITSYMADKIIYYGTEMLSNNTTTIFKPKSYEEIVNNSNMINISDALKVKIVGIIDCSEYLQKFVKLKDYRVAEFMDMSEFSDEYQKIAKIADDLASEEWLNRVYVTSSFIDKYKNISENMSNSATSLVLNDSEYAVEKFGYLTKEINIFTNSSLEKISNLKEDEIIISTGLLNKITNNDFEKKLEEYTLSAEDYNYNTFLINYLNSNNIIGKVVKTSINNNKIYHDLNNFSEYKIIGIYDDLESESCYYKKELIENLISNKLEINKVFANIATKEELKNILKYYPIINSKIVTSNNEINTLLGISATIALFEKISKYASIFFLIFATVLLMNFISNSISFRKKEIGILRGIGCRSKDVIMMFIFEIGVLMLLCLSVSLIIIPVIIKSFNNLFSNLITIDIDFLNFTISKATVLILVLLIIGILGSIIPLRKVTKKKPIDTILDK